MPMASHSLAIAKASVAASLIRPDPHALGRNDIAELHQAIDAAVSRCSPTNVQQVTILLAKHVVASIVRVTALAKYLAALSSTLSLLSNEQHGKGPEKPCARRRQLHILYILNDLLHNVKHHGIEADFDAFALALQQPSIDLVGAVSAYDTSIYVRHHQKVRDLVQHWRRSQYFPAATIDTLEQLAANGGTRSQSEPQTSALEPDGKAQSGNRASEAPYIMPAIHGDPSLPYYELPAANMIPHIVPNTALPINTHAIKPLQLAAGPADDRLAGAVRDILDSVDAIYEPSIPGEASEQLDEAISLELDDMGQVVHIDKQTREILGGDSYYGWSRDFCQQMKRKLGSRAPSAIEQSRSQSRSRSRSRSQSYSPERRHPAAQRPGDRRGRDEHSSRSRSRRRSISRSSARDGRSSSRRRSRSPLRPSRRSRRSPSPREGRTDFDSSQDLQRGRSSHTLSSRDYANNQPLSSSIPSQGFSHGLSSFPATSTQSSYGQGSRQTFPPPPPPAYPPPSGYQSAAIPPPPTGAAGSNFNPSEWQAAFDLMRQVSSINAASTSGMVPPPPHGPPPGFPQALPANLPAGVPSGFSIGLPPGLPPGQPPWGQGANPANNTNAMSQAGNSPAQGNTSHARPWPNGPPTAGQRGAASRDPRLR